MENSKINLLVTGGSGFIGTNVVDYLISQQINFINFDIMPPKKKVHEKFWRNVDIRDYKKLNTEMVSFKPTHILHLAAALGMDIKDIKFFSANTDGVENIIKCAINILSIEHIVFTSSLLVCENGYIPKSDSDYCPPNLYGKSKMIGEKLVRKINNTHFSWSIVRPTSVWGPWFAYSYKKFFKTIDKGYYMHTGETKIIKPKTFVGNTVHMMLTLLFESKEKVSGKTFYLADYPDCSTREWANIIQEIIGAKKIKTVPLWLIKLIAKIGDILKFIGYKDPPLTSFRLQNMRTGVPYPVENTKSVCGELPYSLNEGVKLTANWLYEINEINHKPVE
ncbi:NAD-dependent epimerase/dehydratase family protein [Bacteroidota bacterium]